MKIFLALALVALSTALPAFSGRKLTYGEDGSIIFNGGNGYELNISSSVTKPKALDVVIKAPGVATKSLQIDEAFNIKDLDLKKFFGNKFNSYQDFNQLDALHTILKQYEGNLDQTLYYSLLNKIELLVEAGIFKQSLLNVLRDWDFEIRHHQISDVQTKQELDQFESSKFQKVHSQDEEHEVQGQWNINQEFRSPIERYQGQQYFEEPSEIEASFDQDLQTWFTQQQLVNHQMEQPSQELVRDTINKQALLNQQAEQFIQYLVYQQTRITNSIESLIEQGQIASSVMVNRQRIIYEQVHQLIEKLTHQQLFINQHIQEKLQLSSYIHPQFFDQYKIISGQVYHLIQQVYFQHIHIKQQVKFFAQHEDVFSQELRAIEKLTYHHVEQFIPVLIHQLMYQQVFLRNLMVLANRQGYNIPEVTINHYFNFYHLQHQLGLQGDFVTKQLYYQQTLLHQQIVQLLRENKLSQQTREISQWGLRPVQAYNVLPQWQQRNFLPQQEQKFNYFGHQQQTEEQHSNFLPLQKQHQQEYLSTQQLDYAHEREHQQHWDDNIYQKYPIVY